jgi:hypothetical protein
MMVRGDRYREVLSGGWRVWSVPAWLSCIDRVLAEVGRGGWEYRSKHGSTRRLAAGGPRPAFLKSYRRYRFTDALKELLRGSKAERAAAATAALEAAGFAAAPVVMLGVRRRAGFAGTAFLVSEDVDAPDVRAFLAAYAGRGRPSEKRRLLCALGVYVGRLHEAGFCHGDLVPPNLRVRGDAGAPCFVLIDNDRTRARSRPLSLAEARRNLVQLNRFVVPGVTATDRWRVLRAYCATRCLGEARSRRLARWVMRKTVERRRRFDGVLDARRIGFRALMRADGPGPRDGRRGDTARGAREGRGGAGA